METKLDVSKKLTNIFRSVSAWTWRTRTGTPTLTPLSTDSGHLARSPLKAAASTAGQTRVAPASSSSKFGFKILRFRLYNIVLHRTPGVEQNVILIAGHRCLPCAKRCSAKMLVATFNFWKDYIM